MHAKSLTQSFPLTQLHSYLPATASFREMVGSTLNLNFSPRRRDHHETLQTPARGSGEVRGDYLRVSTLRIAVQSTGRTHVSSCSPSPSSSIAYSQTGKLRRSVAVSFTTGFRVLSVGGTGCASVANDPAHGTRGSQPKRDGWVRCVSHGSLSTMTENPQASHATSAVPQSKEHPHCLNEVVNLLPSMTRCVALRLSFVRSTSRSREKKSHIQLPISLFRNLLPKINPS